MQSKTVCDLFKECEPLRPHFGHQLKIKDNLMNNRMVTVMFQFGSFFNYEHFWKINSLMIVSIICIQNTHNCTTVQRFLVKDIYTFCIFWLKLMHNINVPLYQFSIFVFLVTKCTNFWKKKTTLLWVKLCICKNLTWIRYKNANSWRNTLTCTAYFDLVCQMSVFPGDPFWRLISTSGICMQKGDFTWKGSPQGA